jgi:GMP reductase
MYTVNWELIVRIIDDVKLDYSDVLFVPKRSEVSSRKEVDLVRTYQFKHSEYEWSGVPIMASNMDGVGTVAMAAALAQHDMFTCLVKSYTEDDIFEAVVLKHMDNNRLAVSTGTGEKDFQRLSRIINVCPEIRFICIDVANGYSERFGDYVEAVRNAFPKHTIIAGNVVTADMTQELILRGADIVKVGIGPGSVCTTRIQTGVGYPQLSAIIECADAAHGLGGHIIADGGCTCPGDVAKAFGAGADFVMLGGMLAGHDEGGGELITKLVESSELQGRPRVLADGQTEWTWNGNKVEEKKFVQFYGMSSDTAMEKHHGGIALYRSSEGRTVSVPYRGNVNATVLDLLGGVRSTCTYVGARSLKQLSKCTTFVRVNRQINTVYAGGNN